jgi:phage terminase large subunit
LSILQPQAPRAFAPLLSPARYKGAHGGRGSGKSHFFAEMLVARCVAKKTDAVCVREIQKSLKQSVKKLVESKIADLGVSDQFEVLETEIRGPHGGLIIFQGMQNHTADTIKSLEGYDVAWVEEAQSLSQTSLDLLRPTIRKTGSELWFSWNPKLKTDPVDMLLRGDELPPGAVVVQANYADNPWLPDVLQADMLFDRRRDPEKYAHVWLGAYDEKSEARVFKNWSVEEFDPPVDAVHRFGADWGFAIDPTVLVRCHIIGRKLYVDYEAYMVGCEIDNTPALFDSIPESRRYLITADSARPETVSYMQRNGFPKIVPAIKGPGSVEDGVEFLKNFDIVVHPRCQHVIDELTLYSYKTDKLTGAVLPQLEDKTNHTIDALRYACEGARRAGKATPADEDLPHHATGELGWMS